MLVILYLRGHCDSQVKSRYRCKAIIHHNLQILTCDPLKNKMDCPMIIIGLCLGKSIRMKRVECC